MSKTYLSDEDIHILARLSIEAEMKGFKDVSENLDKALNMAKSDSDFIPSMAIGTLYHDNRRELEDRLLGTKGSFREATIEQMDMELKHLMLITMKKVKTISATRKLSKLIQSHAILASINQILNYFEEV